MEKKKKTKPGGTVLVPVPAVMVSCGAQGYRANIITLAWAGTVCSEPPMVGLGIRPSRYSHAVIKASGEFVVNIPGKSLLRATDYCGVVSGKNVDKFAALGLTAVPGEEVGAPLIAECPLNLEARVRQIVPLGSHDLFIGEILRIHAADGLMDENGRVDLAAMDAFAYGTGSYWAIGQKLEAHGFCQGQA